MSAIAELSAAPFGRLLTAMVTPFNREGGVDFELAARLARYLVDQGSDGIVVCGTTGESPTLSWQEEHQLFETVRNAVGLDVHVLAGTGSNSTAEAVEATCEAAASGADGAMVVDIGGGRAEAAVISMFGMVAKGSIRVGGDKLDQAIQRYLQSRHELVIGERTAEQIKIQIGSAITVENPEKIRVRGKHLAGQPRIVTIDSNEIAKALKEPLAQIVQLIRGVLEQTEPELSSDIAQRGILITGGSANLRGQDI